MANEKEESWEKCFEIVSPVDQTVLVLIDGWTKSVTVKEGWRLTLSKPANLPDRENKD